jgi:hypothetical protein
LNLGEGIEMSTLSELIRLQEALESIAAELDRIEERDHPDLRHAARRLCRHPVRSLETFVSNFELAMRGRSMN